MTDVSQPILAMFGTADFSVGLQLGDLTNDDAVRRARGDTGASISWIVGHLLSYRCAALQACGVELPNPYEEKFSFQMPATDGADYPNIAALRDDWNEIRPKLHDVVAGLTNERLLGESNLPGGDGTLLGALSFTAWHEAYHVGVIGMLRAQWGYRRTHELAMEAMGMEATEKG